MEENQILPALELPPHCTLALPVYSDLFTDLPRQQLTPEKYEDLAYIEHFLKKRPRPTTITTGKAWLWGNHCTRVNSRKNAGTKGIEPKLQSLIDNSIVQRTDEWSRARSTCHVTASSAASAIGAGFSSPARYIEEKVTGVRGEPFQRAVQHGIKYEPECESIFSENYGIKTRACGLISTSFSADGCEWKFGFSPDGFGDGGELLEYKCPWSRELTSQVPLKYYVQVQTQMGALHEMGVDVDECYYVEYRPTEAAERIMAVWHITRDDTFWTWLKTYFVGFSCAINYFKANPAEWERFQLKELTRTRASRNNAFVSIPMSCPPPKRPRLPPTTEDESDEPIDVGAILMGVISRRETRAKTDKAAFDMYLAAVESGDDDLINTALEALCVHTSAPHSQGLSSGDTYIYWKNLAQREWKILRDVVAEGNKTAMRACMTHVHDLEKMLHHRWFAHMVTTQKWEDECMVWMKE